MNPSPIIPPLAIVRLIYLIGRGSLHMKHNKPYVLQERVVQNFHLTGHILKSLRT